MMAIKIILSIPKKHDFCLVHYIRFLLSPEHHFWDRHLIVIFLRCVLVVKKYDYPPFWAFLASLGLSWDLLASPELSCAVLVSPAPSWLLAKLMERPGTPVGLVVWICMVVVLACLLRSVVS